ncbi:MAG: restriction endonuclease subunit S [Clostridia bacterium]
MYDIGLSLLNNYFCGTYDKVLLNEVITFFKGKKPKIISTVKEENYLKYLTIAGLNGQELNYADTEKMLIANQDLLMVMDGASSGDVYYSDYGVVGSTLSRLDIINKKYIKEYIFFCLKKYNNQIKSQNTGSAIPHTDKVFVGSLEIPELDKNIQNQFKVLLEKIQENLKENETLINLRDILLPKLMNGEIDLENIEI